MGIGSKVFSDITYGPTDHSANFQLLKMNNVEKTNQDVAKVPFRIITYILYCKLCNKCLVNFVIICLYGIRNTFQIYTIRDVYHRVWIPVQLSTLSRLVVSSGPDSPWSNRKFAEFLVGRSVVLSRFRGWQRETETAWADGISRIWSGSPGAGWQFKLANVFTPAGRGCINTMYCQLGNDESLYSPGSKQPI